MASAEQLLPDLYEILIKLRYPGIAQANSKDIEETVLGRENRLFLLSWLLAQTSVANCEEFSTNTDESKLIKWYSNMGICNNPDVLMGKVPIHEQTWALKNLLFFMKNVLTVDESNGTVNDLSQITDVLKNHTSKTINIIPTTCNLTSKLNYTEAVQYLKNHGKSLNERENSITEATSVRNDESMKKNDESHEVFRSMGDNDSGSQESGIEEIVTKFVQAFDSVSGWPNPATADSATIIQKSMDNHIDNMHSNMMTLKETLHSKDQVSSYAMMEELKKSEMPLDDVIEEIAIHIEEVSRLHCK